jgi:hypothetical protein
MQYMRIKIVVGYVIIILLCSCERLNLKEEVPDCIKKEIREFSNSDQICGQGASVYRYIFEGKYVYVFDPGNCHADAIAPVFDESCKIICGLGGFIGNTKCKDLEFDENITQTKH